MDDEDDPEFQNALRQAIENSIFHSLTDEEAYQQALRNSLLDNASAPDVLRAMEEERERNEERLGQNWRHGHSEYDENGIETITLFDTDDEEDEGRDQSDQQGSNQAGPARITHERPDVIEISSDDERDAAPPPPDKEDELDDTINYLAAERARVRRELVNIDREHQDSDDEDVVLRHKPSRKRRILSSSDEDVAPAPPAPPRAPSPDDEKLAARLARFSKTLRRQRAPRPPSPRPPSPDEESLARRAGKGKSKAGQLSAPQPPLPPSPPAGPLGDRAAIEEGIYEDYYKFRARFPAILGWLKYLQTVYGDRMSLAHEEGSSYDIVYSDRNYPETNMMYAVRPIGSQAENDYPELPAARSIADDRKRTRNRLALFYMTVDKSKISLEEFPGSRLCRLVIRPGQEAYIKPAQKATRRGLAYPTSFLRRLEDGRAQGKRFVVAVLFLQGTTAQGKPMRHANALIYDTRRGELMRIEPHGTTSTSYDWNFLDAECRALVARNSSIFPNGYAGPAVTCPVPDGPQRLTGRATLPQKTYTTAKGRIVRMAAAGYCGAWSLLIIQRRLQYPDKDIRQIMQELVDMTPNDLERAIRLFAAAVWGRTPHR